MDTITLLKYNGRQGKGTFRLPANRDELVAHCERNSRVWFLSLTGDARQAKVNGRVRTWKRDANRIEIPLKYGMYEYWTVSLEEGLKRILIEV